MRWTTKTQTMDYTELENAVGVSQKNNTSTPHRRKKKSRLDDFTAFVKDVVGNPTITLEGIKAAPGDYKTHAEQYVKRFMERQLKCGNKSGGTMTNRVLSALREIGVEVDTRLRALVKQMMNNEKLSRVQTRNKERVSRSEKYEMLRDGIGKIISWLGECTNKEFKIKSLEFISQLNCSSKSYAREAVDHFNKTMGPLQLRKLRFQVRSMTSIMATTGLRGISFWRMKEDDIKEISGDLVKNGLAIYYSSFKTGSSGAEVTLLTRIVPHLDPRRCPIICLYQYMAFVKGEGLHLFRNGVNTYDYWWKRASTVLQIAAFATNTGEAFSTKKLHALRGYCATFLLERGALKDERQNHLGWKSSKSDIETEHYLLDTVQLTSNPAAFIAGERFRRHGTDLIVEPAPSFWNFLHTITLDSTCEKVCYLAAAAGFRCGKKIVVDPEIAKTVVSERRNKRQRDDRETLEMALTMERAKNSKSEEETLVEAVNKLEALFNEKLKPHCREKTFPARCKQVVRDHMVDILDKWSSPGVSRGLGMGLELTEGFGRDFVNVLRFAACTSLNGVDIKGSWLGWAKANSSYFKSFHNVTKNTWIAFREKIAI